MIKKFKSRLRCSGECFNYLPWTNIIVRIIARTTIVKISAPTPEDFLLRRRILAGETLLALTDLDELLDDFP